MKILDCTLRDGGYYNNWNFSNKVVNDYLSVMSAVSVDYVEIGFRSFETKDFKGPTWYTTESFLNSLHIPKNITLGVMVNASELISHSSGLYKATQLLFKDAKKSKIKLVRLACHFKEFNETSKIIIFNNFFPSSTLGRFKESIYVKIKPIFIFYKLLRSIFE